MTSPTLPPDGRRARHGIVSLAEDGARLRLTRSDVGLPARCELVSEDGPLTLLGRGHAVCVTLENNGYFVHPLRGRSQHVHDVVRVWLLPDDRDAVEEAWCLEAPAGGGLSVTSDGTDVTVHADVRRLEATLHAARPRCDVLGNAYTFDLPDGPDLERAMASFYWDTLVATVAERTLAAASPDADGYVLDTLDTHMYAGTYPDVGHAFHVKGRVLLGNAVDTDVVRRMLELQFRLMREDPERAWRDPCAVQLDGTREYHVRRSSMDGTANAVMFLITGNVEILESARSYVAMTGDVAWLQRHLEDLQGAASLIDDVTDRHGRVWSDVFYEDQVIKDGRVTAAQAFAAMGLRHLADLEDFAGDTAAADARRQRADFLATTLAKPLPEGFWDPDAGRFVDWVDRHGVAHDHGSLLANVAPTLIDAVDPDQRAAVESFLDGAQEAFQRFPTFIAADVAAYRPDEIGIAGPYDLCAIARHWSWDAEWKASRGQRDSVHAQLLCVARRADVEGGYLSERYDMDHVHFVDGQDAHGATRYYEYPAVFVWTLLRAYLGIEPSLDADVKLVVRRPHAGRWRISAPGIAVEVTTLEDSWRVENLASTERRLDLDPRRPGEVARSWQMRVTDALGTVVEERLESDGPCTWAVPAGGAVEGTSTVVGQA